MVILRESTLEAIRNAAQEAREYNESIYVHPQVWRDLLINDEAKDLMWYTINNNLPRIYSIPVYVDIYVEENWKSPKTLTYTIDYEYVQHMPEYLSYYVDHAVHVLFKYGIGSVLEVRLDSFSYPARGNVAFKFVKVSEKEICEIPVRSRYALNFKQSINWQRKKSVKII